MKGYIEIDGKHYISSSRAAEISKYSKDYIGQLCRARKIDSVMMGRSWYVNETALLEYKKTAEEALQERYHEYAVRGSAHVEPAGTVPSEPVTEPANVPAASAAAEIVDSAFAHHDEAAPEPIAQAATVAAVVPIAPVVIAPIVVPPPAWKISYEADDRPLLPILEKKAPASIISASPSAPVKSPFVSDLERIASTAAMIAVLGLGSLYATSPSEFNSSASALASELGTTVSSGVASIQSLSQTASISDAMASVGSFFSNALHGASLAIESVFGGNGAGSQNGQGTTTLATNGEVGGSSTIAFEDYPYYPGPFAAASTTPTAAEIAASLPRTQSAASGAASTVIIREAAGSSLPQLTLRDVDARIQEALSGFQPWHPTYTFISTQSNSDAMSTGASIGQSIGAALTGGASVFNGASLTVTGSSALNSLTLTGPFVAKGTTDLNVGTNMLLMTDSSGIVQPTTTPSVAALFATSTTATSTFAGSLAVGGLQLFVDHSTGNVGLGTTSPSQVLSVQGNGLFSGDVSVANLTATGTITIANNGTSTFRGDILARGVSAWQYLNAPFIQATSTTATSSFAGGILGPNGFAVQQQSGWVGVGSTTPSQALSVQGNALFSGNVAVSSVTATGTIALMQTGTNALIIGDTTGNARGQQAVDVQSTRTGPNQVASGAQSVAMGVDNSASAASSTAVGVTNVASGVESSAFGFASSAAGNNSTALGWTNSANGLGSLAVGYNNVASGPQSVAVGYNNLAGTAYASVFGAGMTNGNANSVVVGSYNGSQYGNVLLSPSGGAVGIGATTSPAATLGVQGDAYVSGNLTVGGNTTTIGNSSSDTLTIRSQVTSDIIPNQNNTYKLGSASFYWNDLYINNVHANNISAASTTIGGTTDNNFIINSDNASSDAESATLVFSRGTVVPNAVIAWDAVGKQFNLNQSTLIQNESTNLLSSPTLILKGQTGQTGDLIQAASSTGDRYLTLTSDGKLGVGTTTPSQALSVQGNGLFSGNVSAANITATGTIATALLGAGTTTPGATLGVQGNALISGNLSVANITATGTLAVTNLTVSGGTSYTGTGTTTFVGDILARGISAWQYLNVPFIQATSTTATSTIAGGLAVGGSKLVVDNTTGYVGIGTSTVTRPLYLQGTSDGTIGVQTTALNNYTGINMFDAAGALAGSFGYGNSSAGAFANQVFLGSRNATAPLVFVTGGANERMRIDNIGNVGIGTSNPTAKLEIASTTVVSPTNYYVNSSWSEKISAASINGSAGLALSALGSGGNPALASLVASPVADYRAALTATYSADNSGAGYFAIDQFSPNAATTYERLRIDANGNVGIGTTTPSQTLAVQGNALVSGSISAASLTATSSIAVPTLTILGGYNSNPYSGIVIGDRTNPANTAQIYDNGNILRLYNGVDAMDITNGGRVGIGTSSPQSALHVEAVGNATLTLNGSNQPVIDYRKGDVLMWETYSEAATGNYIIRNNQGTASNPFVIESGTPNNTIYAATTGNVGIGTSTPNYPLTVQASGTAGNALSFYGRSSDNSSAIDFQNVNGTSRLGRIFTNSAGLNLTGLASGAATVTMGASGNVGIGTTTPGSLLDLYASAPAIQLSPSSYGGTSYSTFLGSNSVAQGELQLGNNNINYIVGGNTSTGGSLQFVVNNTAAFPTAPNGTIAMTMASNGNVGVGTTSPYAKLSIESAWTASNTNDIAVFGRTGGAIYSTIGYDASVATGDSIYFGTATAHPVEFRTAGTERMRIAANGNVGIGTTTPNQKLDVSVASGANMVLERPGVGTYNFGLGGGAVGTDVGDLQITPQTAASGYLFQTSNASNVTVNALAIDKTGKVGIGTTNPSDLLTVNGTSTVGSLGQMSIGDAVNNFVTFTDNQDGSLLVGQNITFKAASGVNRNTLVNARTHGAMAGAAMVIGGNTASVSGVSTDDIGFFTTGAGSVTGGANYSASTPSFIVKAGGNVGIGTTTPVDKLTVQQSSTGEVARFITTNGDAGATTGVTSIGLDHFSLNVNPAVRIEEGEDETSPAGTYKGRLSFYTRGTNSDVVPTERMRIDSAGNVGIGTTSPAALLAVGGNGYFTGNVGIGTSNPAKPLTILASGQVQNWQGVNDTSFVYSQFNTSNNSGLGYVGVEGSTGGTVFTNSLPYATFLVSGASSRALQLGTVGAARLTVDGNGNVGIGTTTPASRLEIQDSSSNLAVLRVRENSSNTATDGGGVLQLFGTRSNGAVGQYGQIKGGRTNNAANNAGYMSFGVSASDGASNAEAMRIIEGGNVGIGTTTPNVNLSIQGTSGGSGIAASIYNNANNSTEEVPLYLSANDNSGAVHTVSVGGRGDGGLAFRTGATALNTLGTIQMMINSSGNVGIGSTSPSGKLTISMSNGGNATGCVNAAICLDRDESTIQGPGAHTQIRMGNNLVLQAENQASLYTFNAQPIIFGTNNSERARFDSSGNFGIGTSSPTVRFSVGGGTGDTSGHAYFTGGLGVGVVNTTAGTIQSSGAITANGNLNTAGDIALTNAGAARITETGGGYLVIGTNSNNVYLDPANQLYIRPSGGHTAMTVSSGASVVNYIDVLGANTGLGPTISAQTTGSDTNIPINISGKGTGAIVLNGSGTGNVGIGTTNPGNKLDVNGVINTNTAVTINADGTVETISPQTNSYSAIRFNKQPSIGGAAGFLGVDYGQAITSTSANGDMVLRADGGNMIFSSSLAEKMRITSAGNVGIGTTSPLGSLTVNQSVNAANAGLAVTGTVDNVALQLANYGTGGAGWWLDSTAGASGFGQGKLVFGTANAAGNGSLASPLVTFQSNGNVGIGTTGPTAPLHVVSADATNMNKQVAIFDHTQSGGGGSSMITLLTATHRGDFEQNGGSGTFRYGTYTDTNIVNNEQSGSGAYGNINFVTGNGSGSGIAMTIGGGTNKGNVGIGTTNPGTKLEVSGTETSNGSLLRITNTTPTTGKSFDLVSDNGGSLNLFARTDNASRMYVQSSTGNIGINTTNPGTKLDVNGNTNISGTLTVSNGINSHTWTATIPAGNYVNVMSFPAGSYGAPLRGLLRVGSTFSGAVTQATYSLDAFGEGLTGAISMISKGNYAGGPAPFRLFESGNPLGAGSLMLNLYNDSATTVTVTYSLTLDSGSSIPTYYNNPTAVAGLPSGHAVALGTYNAALEAASITTTGSVGIGTTTPPTGAKLYIKGDSSVAGLAIERGLGGQLAQNGIVFKDQLGTTYGAIGLDGTVTNDLQLGSAGGIRFYANSNLTTPTGEAMRILSNGNVGIGTTTPTEKLMVTNNGSYAALAVGNGNAYSYFGYAQTATNYTNGSLAGDAVIRGVNGVNISGGNGGPIGLRVDSSGNVGMGTSNPTAPLDVRYPYAKTDTTRRGIIGAFSNEVTNPFGLSLTSIGAATLASRTISLQTQDQNLSNGGNLALQDSGGNVGIGVTSPGSKFVVGADGTYDIPQMVIQGSTVPTRQLFLGYDTSGNFGFIQPIDQGIAYRSLILNPHGSSVGIGTTTPTQMLTVAGNATFDNAATAATVLRLSHVGTGVGAGIQADDGAGAQIFSLTRQASNTLDLTSWGNIGFASGQTGGPSTAYNMYLNSGGGLGVGTTTPYQQVAIVNSGSNALAITGQGGARYIMMGNQDSAGVGSPSMIAAANGALAFGHGTSWTSSVGGTMTQNMLISQSGGISTGAYAAANNDPGANNFVVSGNLGVGTNNPGTKLDVQGGMGRFEIDSPNPYNTMQTVLSLANAAGNSGAGAQINFPVGAAVSYINSVIDGLNSSSGSALTFGTPSSGTNGTERMRISSSGNVGIGTTTPVTALDVYGGRGLRIEGQTGSNPTYGKGLDLTYDTSADHGEVFSVDRTAGAYKPLWVHSSTLALNPDGGGFVGIGTSSPSRPLQVVGIVNTAGGNGGFQMNNRTTNLPSSQWYSPTAGETRLYDEVALTDRLTINSLGNVGIGTTSPSNLGAYVMKLTVSGSSGSNYVRLSGAPGCTTGGNCQAGIVYDYGPGTGFLSSFNNSGLYRLAPMATMDQTGLTNAKDGSAGITMDTSGNVGIGTASPGSRLDVVGAATTVGTPSSYPFTVGGASQQDFSIGSDSNYAYLQSWHSKPLQINNQGNNTLINLNSGNVGIGSTNPTSKLHILGSGSDFTTSGSDLTGDANITGANKAFTGNYGNLTIFSNTAQAADVGGGISFGGIYDASNHAATFAMIKAGKDNGTAGNYSGYLAFSTRTNGLNNAEAMRIASNGNVGIGTTSPSTMLAIEKDPGGNLPYAGLRINNKYSGQSYAGDMTMYDYTDASGGAITFAAIPTFTGGVLTSLGKQYLGGARGASAIESINGNINFHAVDATNTYRQTMTIQNNGNISIPVATATTTIAGGLDVGSGSLRYDFTSGATSIANLDLGNMTFDSDSGVVTWADMPVTSASAAGTIESYTAGLNGNPMITVFGKSDGAGGVTNLGVGVGSTSPWGQLSVNPNGVSGPAFVIGSSTATAFMVDNAGRVAINSSVATSSQLFTVTNTTNVRSFYVTNATSPTIQTANNSLGGPIMNFLKGRGGNINTLAAVQSGDVLSLIVSSGYDGTTHTGGTQIQSTVNGTVSAGIVPADMQFFTTNSSGSTNEVLRLANTGNVGIGTTSPTGALAISHNSGDTLVLSKTTNAPSIRIDGGSGNNFFEDIDSGTNGNLRFGNNARTAIMTLQQSGNIGIGTTSPTALLGLQGAIGVSSNQLYLGATGNVGIGTAGPTAALQVTADHANEGSDHTSQIMATGATDPNMRLMLGYDTTDNNGYIQSFQHHTGATSLALQPQGGNVGIGTTSPGQLLSVAGNGYFTGRVGIGALSTYAGLQVSADGTNGVGSGQLVLAGATNTNKRLEMGYDTTNDYGWIQAYVNQGTSKPLIFNSGGGSVGIGTTSPMTAFGTASTLAVAGQATIAAANSGFTDLTLFHNDLAGAANDNIMRMTMNAGGSTMFDGYGGKLLMRIGNTTSGYNDIAGIGYSRNGADNSGALQLYTASAGTLNERIRIQSNGSVGISTTTPNNMLSVAGAMSVGADYGYAAPTNGLIVEGNVGIGTKTVSTYNLRVGDGTTAGSTSKTININAAAAGLAALVFSKASVENWYVYNPANSTNLRVFDGSSDLMSFTQGGGVAIGSYASGTAAPANTLIVSGGIGIGTSTAPSTLTVTGAGCFSQGAGVGTVACGNSPGNIYYKTANPGNYDVAENYSTTDLTVGAGDIVALDASTTLSVRKAGAGDAVFGIVSTDPGMVLGGSDAGMMNSSSTRPIALSGRVPVKVDGQNGAIKVGDPITISATPGVGMKALGSDEQVGIALESFSGGPADMGTIKVFVSSKQRYDASNLMIAENGNVGIGSTSPMYKLSVGGDIAATSFVNVSTRSAKTDISYLDDTAKSAILDQINGLNIAQYRYKAENQADPLRLGLIAEEAPKQVLAVGGKGVDIYKLTTFALAGIQEQQKQIQSLGLTVSSTTAQVSTSTITIFDLVGLTKDQGDKITQVLARLDTMDAQIASLSTTTSAVQTSLASLQAEVASLKSQVASSSGSSGSADASTTAAALASSTPFISAVASSIQSAVSAAGEWTVNKLTASVVYADRVEAKTVAVTQGFDITDQATGSVWCVTIKNGDWSKVPWSCETPASNVAAAAGATQTTPITQASTANVTQTNVPATQNTFTATSTTSSGTTSTATTTATTVSTTASTTATTTDATTASSTPSTTTTTVTATSTPTTTDTASSTPTTSTTTSTSTTTTASSTPTTTTTSTVDATATTTQSTTTSSTSTSSTTATATTTTATSTTP